MTDVRERCKGQLARFVRRELAGWTGLPAECTEREIDSWLHFREGEAVARFGSQAVEYRVRVVGAAAYSEPVRFFFRHQTLAFARTGMFSFDAAECGRLLGDLGDPEDRLDLFFDVGVVAGGEWVYGARGLAIGVIADTGLIATITVFPPTTVAAYRRLIRNARPPREFPVGGQM